MIFGGCLLLGIRRISPPSFTGESHLRIFRKISSPDCERTSPPSFSGTLLPGFGSSSPPYFLVYLRSVGKSCFICSRVYSISSLVVNSDIEKRSVESNRSFGKPIAARVTLGVG